MRLSVTVILKGLELLRRSTAEAGLVASAVRFRDYARAIGALP
jgi:hypothetical protein